MKYSEYSVVIAGSGAAGLYAALKISQQINLPEGVLLLTKSYLGNSNSLYAQGGIVGVLHQNPEDCVEKHVEDTLTAGAGLSDRSTVEYISEASDEVINDLIENGVDFDRNADGELTFTLEAAHSIRRILHAGGDATGRGITEALCREVRADENIVVMENAVAAELLVDSDQECKGVIVYNELTGEHEIVYTSALVLATGGLGQLYKYTTNPDGATGDGIDLAYNAGAIIQDMEFVQFHPTALYHPGDRPSFLITEAMRGYGGVLRTMDGKEFMQKYDPRLSLAPRDIVARAIDNEMKNRGDDHVYLDVTHKDPEETKKHFPNIYEKCLSLGIDITKDYIPVAPAAHYLCGGILVDLDGQSSIERLYAVGECSCTGLHGGNRLASNSLIEAVVYADAAAKHSLQVVDQYSYNEDIPEWNDEGTRSPEEMVLITQSMKEVNQIMSTYVGIVRSDLRLKRAWDRLDIIYEETESLFKRSVASREICELRNMVNVGYLIMRQAMERKESRGLHYTIDYPHVKK